MSYPGDSQWIFPQAGLETSTPFSNLLHETLLSNASLDLQAVPDTNDDGNFAIDPALLTLQPNMTFQPDLAHSYDNAPTNALTSHPDDAVEAENLSRQIQEFLDFCSRGSQAGAYSQEDTFQVPIQPSVDATLNQPIATVDASFPLFNSWDYPPVLPFPFSYNQPTEQLTVPQSYYPPQAYGTDVAFERVPPQWQVPNGAPPSTQSMTWTDHTSNSAAGQQVVFQPSLEYTQTEPWEKPVHTLPPRRSQRHAPYPHVTPSPSKAHPTRLIAKLNQDSGMAATHDIDEFFACRWEMPGSCTHNLGVLKKDVRNHFQDHHFPHLKDEVLESSAWQVVVECRWHTGDTENGSGLCGAMVKLCSLGNHISGVHSRSVEHVCRFCGRDFSRKDAAKRHELVRRKNGHCPESTGKAPPGKPKKKKGPKSACK